MKFRLFCLLSFGMIASVAQATTWSSDVYYLLHLHFDRYAYQKEVAAVTAHIGVVEVKPTWAGGDGLAYWADVQDVALVREGEAFTAYGQLKTRSGKFGPFIDFPVVQYWLTFTDGSTLISGEFEIPVKEQTTVRGPSDQELLKAKAEDFFQPPVDQTEAVQIDFLQLG